MDYRKSITYCALRCLGNKFLNILINKYRGVVSAFAWATEGQVSYINNFGEHFILISGCSISVVYMFWEHEGRVRFPAPRPFDKFDELIAGKLRAYKLLGEQANLLYFNQTLTIQV